MRGKDLLNVMSAVDVDLIAESEEAFHKEQKKPILIKWIAMAACLCLVLIGAFAAIKYYSNPPGYTNPTEDTESGINSYEGLYIPPLKLPENTDGAGFDMLGLIVYNDGIYTQSEDYYGDEALRIDSLVGDYLGYASGSIDEWSKQDEYAKDFASSVAGEVYSVKGYDTDFRICIRQKVKGESGKPILWIQFLERLNGITLTKGEDLFESRLHIREKAKKIQWQSHDDWDWDKGNIQDAELSSEIWEDFLEQIDASEFVNTRADDNPNSNIESLYDTPNQTHLILTMEDGTAVQLRLIEGGYVGYNALFVQIPGEIFNAVYNACGGTHIK